MTHLKNAFLFFLIISFQSARAQDSSNIDHKVFNLVEVEASFPGGINGWREYLMANLNPNTPVDNGAPEGKYQVIVRFIVSKDGTISEVVSETKHGFGMEAECIRVIKNGPKWIPAMQNGRNVNAYRRQPITFAVEVEKKGRKRKHKD